VREKFVGGLRLPGDETGDCQMFTRRLAALCAERGVRFVYDAAISIIEVEAGKIVSVATSAGPMTADAYVMALGSFSPIIGRKIGISIPVYPVKGYSITVPIVDADASPVSTIMDESYKVAITRLGNHIRVGGTAEISGYDLRLHQTRRDTLEYSVGDLFPDGGALKGASFWCGLRPMTPDGPPIIGRTKLANLYLNTGHGTLGWTMACGSGRVTADIISGRQPDIDVSALSIARYG
jgi:D-amino-acid dehydrogenase